MIEMKVSEILFVLICYSFVLVYCHSEIPLYNGELTCEYEDEAGLDLSNSGLERIKASFAKSHVIKYLNLKNNSIDGIDNRAFGYLPQLVCLDLANNKIHPHQFNIGFSETIETLILNNAFDYYYSQPEIIFIDILTSLIKLPNLKKLSLGHNHMGSLNIYSNEMILYLNEKGITSKDFFQLLPPTLSHLYLNNNDISQLSCRTLNNLHVLVMDYNKIHSLCGNDRYCNGMTLKGAVNLRSLSIINVGLQQIESDAFDDLIKLHSLDMSYNQINKFVPHTFDNLTNLTMFRLDSNNLITVPIICQLERLEFFSLAYNQIEEMDELTFCNLPKLKTLILNNNKLNHIVPGIFNNLKSLEELDLSSNILTSLPENWISSNTIRRLTLSDNLFTNIASISLDNIKTLEYLDIWNNNLKLITVKEVLFLPENTTIHMNYC